MSSRIPQLPDTSVAGCSVPGCSVPMPMEQRRDPVSWMRFGVATRRARGSFAFDCHRQSNCYFVATAQSCPRMLSCRMLGPRMLSCRMLSCRMLSCRMLSCRMLSCRMLGPRMLGPRMLRHHQTFPNISNAARSNSSLESGCAMLIRALARCARFLP